MTKRELAHKIANAMQAITDNKNGLDPVEQMRAQSKLYDDSKNECRMNGYVSGSFTQIWNAAARMHAISINVYVPGGEV